MAQTVKEASLTLVPPQQPRPPEAPVPPGAPDQSGSDPQMPPGWTSASGIVEAPGSIVRVRTKEEPAPPTREYAKKVLEARQQNAPLR